MEWLRYLGHRLRILTRMIRHHTDTQPHPREAFYPVSVIEQEARAIALSVGISTPDDAAAALVERVLMRLVGGQLKLPKKRAESPRARHQEIRAQFRHRG